VTCSKCLKDIPDLAPYFMVDGVVLCYDCKRSPEPDGGKQ
jgi:hypothetical protein